MLFKEEYYCFLVWSFRNELRFGYVVIGLLILFVSSLLFWFLNILPVVWDKCLISEFFEKIVVLSIVCCSVVSFFFYRFCVYVSLVVVGLLEAEMAFALAFVCFSVISEIFFSCLFRSSSGSPSLMRF